MSIPVSGVVEEVGRHAVQLGLEGEAGALELGLVGGGARAKQTRELRHAAVMTRHQALMGGYQVSGAEILRRNICVRKERKVCCDVYLGILEGIFMSRVTQVQFVGIVCICIFIEILLQLFGII